MTGRQYIDEVKLRLARHQVLRDLNDPQLLTFVNNGRRAVQQFTMALYRERFGKIYRAAITQAEDTVSRSEHGYLPGVTQNVYMFDLPSDFMEWEVAILMWVDATTGVTYRRPIREVTKQELFSAQTHSWSGGTTWSPLFTVDRQINRTGVAGGTYPWVLYLSGLNKSDGTTLFDDASSVQVEVWYVAALDWLEYADDDVQLQDDMEEFVVYYAMLEALELHQDVKTYNSVVQDLQGMQQQIKINYELKKQKHSSLLPSKEGED